MFKEIRNQSGRNTKKIYQFLFKIMRYSEVFSFLEDGSSQPKPKGKMIHNYRICDSDYELLTKQGVAVSGEIQLLLL